MEDSIFRHPLKVLFGLVTMSIINDVFLLLIPSWWASVLFIIVLDFVLWGIASKWFEIYDAIVCFFCVMGGLVWIAWWDIQQIRSIIAGTFMRPGIGESLQMLAVGVITIAMFWFGSYYLNEYKSLKSTEK